MNDLYYQIIPRSDAKKQGLKKYFTAKLCIHGHIDERYTISGKCKTCQQIQSKSWNQSHPEYYRQWTKDNQEWIKNNYKRDYRENYIKWLVKGAKSRAKRKGIPFNLRVCDILIPTHCPVLGIELKANKGHPSYNSPSIDRIIPELGYIQDNIIIVSFKANLMKSDSTIDELEKVYQFYKNLLSN